MNSLPDMLADLARVFPNGPSWPFRTESGRRLWNYAENIFDKHPDWPPADVLRAALDKSEIPGSELTQDDQVILTTALRWKAMVLRRNNPPKEKAGPYRFRTR